MGRRSPKVEKIGIREPLQRGDFAETATVYCGSPGTNISHEDYCVSGSRHCRPSYCGLLT